MSLKIFEEKRRNILISRFYRLLLVGLAIGLVWAIAQYTQDWIFTLAAFFYSLLSIAGSYFSLRSMPLQMQGWKARKEDPEEQQLLNIVEELKLAASYHNKIDVYVIPDPTINAFAYSLGEKAVIGVNQGALKQLNRSETSALVGHELSHIINKDSEVKVSTYLILAFIGAIANFTFHSLRAASYSRSRDRGKIVAYLLPLAIGSFVVLFLAQLIFYAVLRRREALADVEGVRLTRDKEGMLSLLKKLKAMEERAKGEGLLEGLANQADVKAAFYFWNPASLFSSHPPLDERIKTVERL